MIRFLLPAAILLLSVPAFASLYQPEEPIALAVKPDGVPDALEFDEFQQRAVTLANVADPRPTPDGKPNRDRAKVLDRVKAFAQKKNPTPDELAIHSVDLLRLGNLDRAIDLLVPHTRDRNLNYFLMMTLVQVHLARGEAREAVNVYENAMLDVQMPATVKGWSEPQRKWFEKLDNDYVGHYLRLKLSEKDVPVPPDREEPIALFPLLVKDKPTSPVRFVNDAGQYETGNLAKAERDKLPPDAVAIVQQMLLWFPTDTRLYWLLAELYAAEGKIDEADTIFYQCTWGRQFGNRRVLMEHKGAVMAAIEARRKARDEAEIASYPINLQAIWYYFAGVVLIAGVAFVRSWSKKSGGSKPCSGG